MSHKVNLVRVLTAATGNSTPITLGARYSTLFKTPAEAGAIDGRTYTYLIVDGNDYEYGRGVYTASGTSLSRNVLESRVAGTLGTSRINLSGTAQVRFVELAEDMDGMRGTRAVTGTTDVLMNSDHGYVVTFSNASAIAASLAQAGAGNAFLDGWMVFVKNKNVGPVTITPTTSTMDGDPTLVLQKNQGAMIWSDNGNYQSFRLGNIWDGPTTLSTAQKDRVLDNIGLSIVRPSGRLTLTTGVPVMSSAVSAAGTVYFTPYQGNCLPIWSPTTSSFVPRFFTELSNVLANSTTGKAGPTAAAANSLYDLFVWDDAGTLRLTRGPAWTNDTTRSMGLSGNAGVQVNSSAITNGPATGQGLYVGTIGTDSGGATVTFSRGSSAAGGGTATIGLWNAFNRVPIETESTNSSTWSVTSTTVRSIQGSTGMRATFVSGIAEDYLSARYQVDCLVGNGVYCQIGVALDTTAAFEKYALAQGSSSQHIQAFSEATFAPQLGRHYVGALEAGDGSNSTQFAAGAQNGFNLSAMF